MIRFLFLFLICLATSFCWAGDNPPYKTIEEAVIASGGTYGVIDVSNPDATTNFVDTIFDKGLTNQDDRGGNLVLRPGVEFSAMIKDPLMGEVLYYNGRRGERVTITVKGENFAPDVDFTDSAGKILAFDANYDGNQKITLEHALSYKGGYYIKVLAKGGKSGLFRIRIESDDSSVVTLDQTDTLVEGGTYTIAELQNNFSKNNRRFFAEAYYVLIPGEVAPCPPEAYSCPMSLGPRHLVSDENFLSEQINEKYEGVATIVTTNGFVEKKLESGKKYCFEFIVTNRSRTDVPQNSFDFFSVKE